MVYRVVERLRVSTRWWKVLLLAIILGVFLSLVTGLVANQQIGIPEVDRYGYPLIWRETNLNGPTEYILSNLVIDIAFWLTISLVGLIILEFSLLKLGIDLHYKTILLLLTVFIPLGLVMDLVHECGHAIWGTIAGGRLTYMQIGFFQLYPKLSLTPNFRLGYVQVAGLTTHFAYGLMGLGGSLTTNIASWLLALIILTRDLGRKTRIALKTLGLFGILDLPLYVILPQMGLKHWIFVGGCTPEPLLAARKIGIPDSIFYMIVTLTTFGLIVIYIKPLRQKSLKIIKSIRRPHLLAVVIGGILISLATGSIENPPEASIIGARYYGYPLVWRVTTITINYTTYFKFTELALDILFWTTILFLAFLAIHTALFMLSRNTEYLGQTKASPQHH